MSALNENSWKKFFNSRWFILLALAATMAVAVGFGRAYYQDYLVTQDIERLRDQAGNLAAKKIELLEVLKYVKSDSFAEQKARTELNMIKPGERVLVVSKLAENEDGQEKNNMVGFSQISNYKKWWRYFSK